MSPLTLRRYRAERLLRAEFERLRANVIATVAARLRAAGARVDASDLDAAYAQAWHGLYTVVLDGEQVASAEAWLIAATHRRAIDEHRSRTRAKRLAPAVPAPPGRAGARRRREALADGARLAADGALAGLAASATGDLAERLDERVRVRQLLEALRMRLTPREREAATLCYLHGLSRAEAAARMGVSERRMHKLMDGRGDGSPGVAGKLGAIAETIAAGRWCEQQGSLMRGLAYGVHDPAGERHALAQAHSAECPACRAYVLSLRGLAAVLPPAPCLLHALLGSGACAGAASAASRAGAGASHQVAGGAAGNGAGALAGAPAGTAGGAASAVPMGAGALSASGAAGGGWWLAGGSLGAKLAAGCVLALGLGAGCAALGGGGVRAAHTHARAARRPERVASSALAVASDDPPAFARPPALAAPKTSGTSRGRSAVGASAPVPAARAAREFGPEQAAGAGAATDAVAASSERAATARAAAARSAAAPGEAEAGAGGGSGSAPAGLADAAASARGDSAMPAAQREFAPG